MRDRFLLYIDILGFANYVAKDTMQVRRIYKIIEGLNAHHHDAFKVIVFSDTVLVYNLVEPITDHERNYYVMFLIEFAQNLHYEFAGKQLYFRALLVNGEFEHIPSGKFEKYFGKALVNAYLKEKTIKCTGLFIDNASQNYNIVFPVTRYDRDLSFVHYTQTLDRFYRGELGDWPVNPSLLADTDFQWDLAKDIYFLRDIFKSMRDHRDDNVRLKMTNTWHHYENRYPTLIHSLVSQNFSLSVLSVDFDWKAAISQVMDGYRGFSDELPSFEELKEIIVEARSVGSLAAETSFKAIYGDYKPGEKFYAPCGGGSLILDIDGRSRMARLLSEASSDIEGFFFSRSFRSGYSVTIRGMSNFQERDVNVAAGKAALKVLQDRLGVVGYVREYYD